jgi:hypothetical protein
MHADAHLAGLERPRRRLLDRQPAGPVEHELAHGDNLYDGVPVVQQNAV